MRKFLLFILLWLFAAVGAHAQGTWSGAQTLSLAYMPHGFLNYQYLLLNYSQANKAVLLVYEHENSEGDNCYTNGGVSCTALSNSLANGGAGPQDWYNNSGFQSRYCATGCIIALPYADQTPDPSGQNSNFGGHNDTPDSQPNERAVVAMIQQFQMGFNVDPARIYVTGDSLGGIGAWAMCLDHGVGNGTVSKLVAACMPFSGEIFRTADGGFGSPIANSTAAQVASGPIIFAINGSGDTQSSNPVNWTNPMWTALAGNSTGGGGVPAPSQAAAVGYTTQTYGPLLVVGTNPMVSPLQAGTNWQPFNFFGTGWNAYGVTTNADGSITIPANTIDGFGAQISTAAFQSTPSPYIQGTAFGGGFYAEVTMAFAINPTTGGPAFWANDIESMAGGSAGDLTLRHWPGQVRNFGDWIENDIAEFDANVAANQYGISMHNFFGPSSEFSGQTFQSGDQTVNAGNLYSQTVSTCVTGTNTPPTGTGTGIVDGTCRWNFVSVAPSGNAGVGNTSTLGSGSKITFPAGTDLTKQHKYGALWVPATATTQGYMKYFFDGVQVGNTCTWNQYNANLGPPPVDNSNPCGGSSAYSVMDTRHMALILGNGTTVSGQNPGPVTVYSVNVWQSSAANNIVNGTTQSTPSGFPGPPVGGRAASSSYYYLLDTSLGHDVWDTYRPLPTGQPMLDILFAAKAPTPAPPGAALPSGYLSVSGNQIQDGNGNNIRLSCTGYTSFANTGSISNDLAVMRGQGFNCARVAWFDATTCPGGTCNFTTMDQIVSIANSNNMKVIFDHHGNEGVDGGHGCLTQQYNGLWYDLNASTAPWNQTNNTDGCGTTGTVSYATFKSNWVQFANHYNNNQTVIGFDLHNEPTTAGNPTCCGSALPGANWGVSGGGGGGTGAFSVSGGKVLWPNGTQAALAGVALGPTDLATYATNAQAQPLTQVFPKINFVRVAFGEYADAPNAFDTYINRLTALGIIVILEDHQNFNANGTNACNCGGGQGVIFTNAVPDLTHPGQSVLTTELNWYAALASHYANNPYVWFGTTNEPSVTDPNGTQNDYAGLFNWQQQIINAIRNAGSNAIVEIEEPNPYAQGPLSGVANPFSSYHNIIYGPHYYSWIFNGQTNATATSAMISCAFGSSSSCPWGGIDQQVANLQQWQSADGVVPIACLEFGPSTNGTTLDAAGMNMVNAVLQVSQAGTLIGYNAWHLVPDGTPDALISNTTTLTSPYGTTVETAIAGGQGPIVGGPPSNNTNAGADLKAMANDVGAAIIAADPGALIVVEGILNSGTLFNGTTRGSSGLPVTNGPVPDLTTVSSNPLTCCSKKIVFSIHDFPTSITNGAPDSGPNMVTIRNTAWGFLEAQNLAPVWIGAMGADLDNANGQLSDETAWASGLLAYMNGTAMGAPTFTACQQPIGGDWWQFGNLPMQAPDGSLNADGTNKAGQQTYWGQMLYTTCSGTVVATTWNPNDITAGIALSNSNKTATTSAAGGVNSVRSTTSQSGGKVCADFVAPALTVNWDVGLANSSFALSGAGGLGADSNGIGFDPLSSGGRNGIFFKNAAVSTGPGVYGSPFSSDFSTAFGPIGGGDTATVCADLTNQLFWVTTLSMRTAGNPWNNSASANPATGAGGISFSGLTGPYFLVFNSFDSGSVATLNPTGPFAVATPSGFSAWQASTPVVTGHPFVLIFGDNDNTPPYDNDNSTYAFATPVDLTVIK